MLGAILALAPMGTYGVLALCGLLLAGLAWAWHEAAALRNKYERLGKMPPLSENDLHRARSKLVNRAKH